jgi:hypothetical protein
LHVSGHMFVQTSNLEATGSNPVGRAIVSKKKISLTACVTLKWKAY